MAFSAIVDLQVSTDSISLGKCLAMSSIAGIILASSSDSVTNVAPGREEAPPISMIFAPSVTNWRTLSRMVFSSVNLPPSKKESGVIFKMPITCGCDMSIKYPLQLML